MDLEDILSADSLPTFTKQGCLVVKIYIGSKDIGGFDTVKTIKLQKRKTKLKLIKCTLHTATNKSGFKNMCKSGIMSGISLVP